MFILKNVNRQTITPDEANKMPFYMSDYIGSLPPSINTYICEVDSTMLIHLTDTPNEIFENEDIRTGFVQEEYDKSDKNIVAFFYRIPVDMNADKMKEEIHKIREFGFVDITNIIGYENSLIFMKSTPEEHQRFVISQFLYSFKVYQEIEGTEKSIRLETMLPFNKMYFPRGINIETSMPSCVKTTELKFPEFAKALAALAAKESTTTETTTE